MTQCERIMRHLEKFGSISTYEAFTEYGITRLASRICDLRQQGIEIKSEFKTSKNRFGEPVSYCVYSLADDDKALKWLSSSLEEIIDMC